MSQITTHVLDTSRGSPAEGVPVLLEVRSSAGGFKRIGRAVTNADGRVTGLLPKRVRLAKGIYRITFQTSAYFRSIHAQGFYPSVSVLFVVREPKRHLHVPLLLSPYGYSTYRGS